MLRYQNFGPKIVEEIEYGVGDFNTVEIVRALKMKNTQSVFYFGKGQQLIAFLNEAENQNWYPKILSPAELAGKAMFYFSEKNAKNVYLTSPWSDTSEKSKRFLNLIGSIKENKGYSTFDIVAFVGACLFEEGLILSGREVSRSKIIKNVGNLLKFDTGVVQPLTFDDNQRIGSMALRVINLDYQNRRIKSVSDWLEPAN